VLDALDCVQTVVTLRLYQLYLPNSNPIALNISPYYPTCSCIFSVL